MKKLYRLQVTQGRFPADMWPKGLGVFFAEEKDALDAAKRIVEAYPFPPTVCLDSGVVSKTESRTTYLKRTVAVGSLDMDPELWMTQACEVMVGCGGLLAEDGDDTVSSPGSGENLLIVNSYTLFPNPL